MTEAKFAFLSVYDKTDIVGLGMALTGLGFTLVSSGGTARVLREHNLDVLSSEELTGYPAILGHRVVTLHPKVHGGILANRSKREDLDDLEKYDIHPFDLVVCNLYPFASEPSVEQIDIGGPAMVRGAAKNHAFVGVVVDPADYQRVADELTEQGALSDETRRQLARKAFAHTAAYDAAIVNWFDQEDGVLLPDTLHHSYTKAPMELRYGENPHQQAAVYQEDGKDPWWTTIVQHSGLALSYLNLYDADAAWQLVHEPAFGTDRAICAIIKHANPCGFAIADDLATAYQRAFECDERSAFGGIVAVNRPIDDDTVKAMVAAAQADVVIAPGYQPGVLEQLQAKRKNTRLIGARPPESEKQHLRPISGGLLVQEPHHFASLPNGWEVKTERFPTPAELVDAWTAFVLCGYVKSNSIVLVKDNVAWGIGAGQQNRVESGQIATQKAAGRATGGACASDAFYPFPDGIEAAAAAGVSIVVQPGGAQRDDACIARANELGVAMVFTGERHFLH